VGVPTKSALLVTQQRHQNLGLSCLSHVHACEALSSAASANKLRLYSSFSSFNLEHQQLIYHFVKSWSVDVYSNKEDHLMLRLPSTE
jgi:hypothetical protein